MAGSTPVLNTFRLDDRSVIVTGASRGIGRALAKGFAYAGADVAILYEKTRDRAESLFDEVRTLGRARSNVSEIDFGTPEDRTRMAAEAEEHWRKPAVQNRFGRPDELAAAVVYIASDASTFMTGEEMVVDGSMAASLCADNPQEAVP